MGRTPRPLPRSEAAASPAPAHDEVLSAALRVLAPLLQLLLAAGVDYTRLAAELKPLYIEQARLARQRSGRGDTDSANSLLSGVHRKDVREWRRNGLAGRIAKELSVGAKVYARWVQDPLYRDRRKRPRPLPRLGEAPSFETLARSVTQDVHPYTVLTELVRLGLVRMEGRDGREMVVPSGDGYVPARGSGEALALFGGNVADHLAAAVDNLLGAPPTLEQSVFAEGITPASAQALAELARTLWMRSRSEMIAEATRRYEADQGREDATVRMRFGAYYRAEDTPAEAPERAAREDSDETE